MVFGQLCLAAICWISCFVLGAAPHDYHVLVLWYRERKAWLFRQLCSETWCLFKFVIAVCSNWWDTCVWSLERIACPWPVPLVKQGTAFFTLGLALTNNNFVILYIFFVYGFVMPRLGVSNPVCFVHPGIPIGCLEISLFLCLCTVYADLLIIVFSLGCPLPSLGLAPRFSDWVFDGILLWMAGFALAASLRRH